MLGHSCILALVPLASLVFAKDSRSVRRQNGNQTLVSDINFISRHWGQISTYKVDIRRDPRANKHKMVLL